MRILLTAFSPFNGATENTSLAVVTNLAELLPNHKTQVLELPVAFANSHKVAISTAKQFRPDIILSFGEDATRNSINVETQAYNHPRARPSFLGVFPPLPRTFLFGPRQWWLVCGKPPGPWN